MCRRTKKTASKAKAIAKEVGMFCLCVPLLIAATTVMVALKVIYGGRG